ncbi:MAG: hypothetical protein GY765_09085 [bacterium]|nr:hypothetical protein [bacterium]
MTNLVEAMATLEQTGTQLKTHARENSQLLPGIYDSLGTLETSVDSHAGGIKRLEKELNDLQAKEAPPAKTETEEEVFLSVQMLNVERAILKDTWNMKALESPKKILYALLQAGENRTGAEALTGVNSGENAGVNVKALVHGCHRLGSLLKGNESLLTLHNRTFTPLRRYTETLEEFLEVCELLKESPVSPDDAADYSAKIAAFRLKIDFLLSLRDGEVVHRLVSFRVRVWVSEEFLEFADRYLREYGRAVLAETLSENQKEVANLVNEILEYGDLRPVPILLGETYFDSNQHIGRSHTKESSMKNGTIAEVVKSGFETLAGETVQQPEVIVNRI